MKSIGQRHTNWVEPTRSDFKFEAHFLRQAASYLYWDTNIISNRKEFLPLQ